jgi:RNA polymerase sigma factor (sigma-70 family)
MFLEQYRAWLAAATPVADCPTMRVLELILLDHARTGAPDQGFWFLTALVETLDAAGIVTASSGAEAEASSPGPRASLAVHRSATREGCRVAKERVERDEEDLVRLYLTDIGQYPLLTKDDEVRLAQQIEIGNGAREELLVCAKDLTATKKRELRRTSRLGDDAQRTFVQSNLRLVVSIAKKYQASGLPLLDLIQEGNLGLMHAVEKFDWRKGFKFSTYATWWIRQAITRGIANTGRTIRLPVHAGDTLARLQKARSRLELKLGRPATLAELSAEVEMPEDKVTEALRFAAEPLSLSEPLREDGDAELGDIVEDRSAESPFEVAATALLPDEIEKLLSPLDERERQILALRFGLDRGEPRTLEEVGEHFNLTRERIRQIEARAMSKLRHPSADTGARDLLAV